MTSKTDTTASSNKRRLERTQRRVIAGVCAGLADTYSRPVWLVRFVFALLACAGGGVLLYVLLWLVIPSAGEQTGLAEQAWRERHEHPLRVAAFGLILFGLLAPHVAVPAAAVVGVALLFVWKRRQEAC